MPHGPSRNNGFFEFYEELIGTWTRRLRNRQHAEDLAHDAFIKVLEGDEVTVSQPRAYLHRIARNIAVDRHRQAIRRGQLDDMQQQEEETPSADDPEAHMHAVQLADSIEQALSELPPNCRKVFVWHKLEGLNQVEIAERLGVSRNMVERYMIRTLRHLRDRLDAPTR